MQIKLHGLRETRQVSDDQDDLVFIAAQIGQYPLIARQQKLERATSKRAVLLAQLDQTLGPVQQRIRILLLRFHVDRFVVVRRVDIHRQVEPLRIRAGKPGIAVRTPLHGCPHAVAIAEVDVVAHPDFIAVVNNRRPRKRKQQGVHYFNPCAIVAKQRSQPPANTKVNARPLIRRIDPIHVVALFIGHHLERKLVVVAKEHGPLAGFRNIGRPF